MARLLSMGDKGAEVALVQSALNTNFPQRPLLEVDGVFGAQTLARLIAFQKTKGLAYDGVVGPATRAALFPDEGVDLERLMQERIVGLTVECFETKVDPKFRCQPDGPPVSAYDFALCRYLDALLEGELGLRHRQKAEGEVSRLRFLLDRMLADFSEQGSTVGDLLGKWSFELRSFDRQGIKVSDFIARQLTDCYTRASHQVENERRSKSSDLGRQSR